MGGFIFMGGPFPSSPWQATQLAKVALPRAAKSTDPAGALSPEAGVSGVEGAFGGVPAPAGGVCGADGAVATAEPDSEGASVSLAVSNIAPSSLNPKMPSRTVKITAVTPLLKVPRVPAKDLDDGEFWAMVVRSIRCYAPGNGAGATLSFPPVFAIEFLPILCLVGSVFPQRDHRRLKGRF